MKLKVIYNSTDCSLRITRVVLLFVLLFYCAWIGAWLLEQTLEGIFIWLSTSQGRFLYWLCMKIIIWIIPSFFIIRYLGKTVNDIMGIKRVKSIIIWGGGVGLILVVLTIVSKLVSNQLHFSIDLSWPFIGGVIIAPIVEEITFRGAILEGLKQRYTFLFANLVTALLFLGIHLPGWYFQETLAANVTAPVGGALSIFILGFVFGFVVHKSKSVSSGIVAHILNNLSNMV